MHGNDVNNIYNWDKIQITDVANTVIYQCTVLSVVDYPSYMTLQLSFNNIIGIPQPIDGLTIQFELLNLPSGMTVYWADILDKPSTYPASPHTIESHSDFVSSGAESNGQVLTFESGNWTNMNPTGEANTCSNIGTAGVGVYKDKVGVDFELKNINVGDKLTVTDDTLLNTVDIAVDPSATFPPSAHTIESHSDVQVSSLQLNDFLGWNGTYWVNSQLPNVSYNETYGEMQYNLQPTWGTPAAGEVMVNNTSYFGVTELRISVTDNNSKNCTQRLTRLAIGDTIAVFQYDQWCFVAITGIANDTTYFDFGVSVLTSNGSPPVSEQGVKVRTFKVSRKYCFIRCDPERGYQYKVVTRKY